MDLVDQFETLLTISKPEPVTYNKFFREKFREIDDLDPEASIYQKIRQVNILWQKKQK